MKLVAIADEPFHKTIKLTFGKEYEVLSYLERDGNKLFLIEDDEYQTQTLNVCHFVDVKLI